MASKSPVRSRSAKRNEDSLPVVSALRSEIKDLSCKLLKMDAEKEHLEKQLNKSQKEQIKTVRESSEKLDEEAFRYEAKITELHSIVAELTRKLDGQRIKVIREEDEDSDQSKDTNSCGSSNNNNANESCTDNEDSHADLTRVMVEYGSKRKIGVGVNSLKGETSGTVGVNALDGGCSTSQKHERPLDDDADCYASVAMQQNVSEHVMQVAQLQEEVLLLRTENEALHQQAGQQEMELTKNKGALSSLRDERDRLRRKVRELHSKLQNLQSQGSQGSQTGSPTRSRGSNVTSCAGECSSPTHREEAPVTKIAERVKLKRVESGDRHISGSEISSLGVSSSKVVEHLVQHMQEESNAQEIFRSLHNAGSLVSEPRVREFEVETERLNSKIEHLRSQNDLQNLTLAESRAQCERLSVLISKYESNNVALQIALGYSDQAAEATEALLRLLESEMALVVAKCHAAGMIGAPSARGGDDEERQREEASLLLRHAQDNRRTVEAVGRRLLRKLERHRHLTDGRPWDELTSGSSSSHTHTNSTLSSTEGHGHGHEEGGRAELTKADEQRLRDHVLRLKSERAAVKMTVADLESVHVDPVSREPSSSLDAQKLDLENAVLMQELMALKEEKAELKAHVYLLEKDRASLELRLNGREAQEQAYIAHIEHLKCEVKEHQQHELNGRRCQCEQAQCMEQSEDLSESLVEALHREKKLKGRIQELVGTLEKVTRNSEMRNQQSTEFVNDLKRTNSALIAAFERSKRKYQMKIKKMDQQITTLTERHTAQVQLLHQKIDLLEDHPGQSMLAASETSL